MEWNQCHTGITELECETGCACRAQPVALAHQLAPIHDEDCVLVSQEQFAFTEVPELFVT